MNPSGDAEEPRAPTSWAAAARAARRRAAQSSGGDADRAAAGAHRHLAAAGGCRRGRKFYITTAIDYANGDPHIGHALEKIGADAIARYHRLLGDDVHFLIGMDEHGQKVAQTAAERGLSPQAFVDEIAARFRGTWDRLGISYDQFIRTTDPAHKSGVRALIKRIHESSPGRLLREDVRRVVLRRLRGVQAGQRDRRRQVHSASDADAGVDDRSATGSSA